MAFSDKKKRETLTLLAANGNNVSQTAKQAGVDRKTIYNWLRDGVPEAEDIAGAIAVALSLVLPNFPDFTQPGNAHAYPAAIRELVRAYALLTGNATDRTENLSNGEKTMTDLQYMEARAAVYRLGATIMEGDTPPSLRNLLNDPKDNHSTLQTIATVFVEELQAGGLWEATLEDYGLTDLPEINAKYAFMAILSRKALGEGVELPAVYGVYLPQEWRGSNHE